MAKRHNCLHTKIMSKACVYNTFETEDKVTYQILAYRLLKADEARKKVTGFLSKTSPKERPHAGDVVIINTAIGLHAN